MSNRKRARAAEERPESPESESTEQMSSGHRAGLHTADSFKRAEDELRRDKAAKLSRMSDELSGKNSETVYRDRQGRKLDMLSEFMRQQEEKESKREAEREEYEWGKGMKGGVYGNG
eukprot:scaffold1724_cov246-Pinguiococcus_pyrenoidosus.AAC.24